MNPCLCTDSYKLTHWKQYPPGTEYVHSYLEARGGMYNRQVMFGMQYLLNTALAPFDEDDIDEAEAFCVDHFGQTGLFNRAGFDRIIGAHTGHWPVRIRAVPEGLSVPLHNVLVTMENTDPMLPWVTNFLETKVVQLWYPITVATVSQHCRRTILHYLRKTGTPADVDFKLQDFGFRGVSSEESALIGGMAHLVNFKGSDTIPAIVGAKRHYYADMAGFSIPGSEHSTITSWFGPASETAAYRNILRQYPEGLVACVSDSLDIYVACDALWGTVLREDVLSRNGVLIIRPDSGDPPEVVLKCLRILYERFGGTLNIQGYRVLDSHVRLIQGDGVDPVMIDRILDQMAQDGWSADNIAFGMGGALLQKLNRDTCQMAMKCSAVTVNGRDYPVSKSPVDAPLKHSKAGRLTLMQHPDGHFETVTQEQSRVYPQFKDYDDVMRIVYEHNRDHHYVIKPETLDTIRERARQGE